MYCEMRIYVHVMFGFWRHVPNYGSMHFWSADINECQHKVKPKSACLLMPRDLLRVTHAVEAEHLYVSVQTVAFKWRSNRYMNKSQEVPTTIAAEACACVSRRPSSKWRATLRVLNS